VRERLLTVAVLAALAAGCGREPGTGPRNTMPDMATHSSRYFPIASGNTHGAGVGQTAPDCNGCHADTSVTPPVPSASFKIFTCTNCHVMLRSGVWHDDAQPAFSAWHVAAGVNNFDSTVAASNVLGVGKLDEACRACHASGLAVNHDIRFKLPHQDAAATIVAKCADCHVNPADRLQLGCAQCHPHDLPATTTGHALVPDFSATNSALCARCHEDGKIPVAVSAHAAGAGGFIVGSGVHSGAAGGACLTCHAQNRTTVPRTFVADFSVSTCIACHVTVGGSTTAYHDDATSLGTLHASVSTFTTTVSSLGLSAACLSCHADGAGGAPANHELLFPRGTGTKHAGISCAQCHGTGLKTDLTALACDSCHGAIAGFSTKHAAIGGVSILNLYVGHALAGTVPLTSPNCVKCHSDSQVDRIASHPSSGSGPSRSEHAPAGCLSCHATPRSDKPYPAIDFTQPSPASTSTPSCATSCHNNVRG
jgi:hypothetical protein